MTSGAVNPVHNSGHTASSWRAPFSRPVVRRTAAVLAATAVVALDVRTIDPYVSRAAEALSHPVLPWLLFALAAEIVSLVSSAHLQRRMLSTTGTAMRMPTAVGVTYAAYALNQSLPAGPAVSAGYTFRRLRQIGATTPTAAFTVLSSSVLSLLAYGLLAVAGFTVAGGSSGGPFAVVLGLVVAALMLLFTRSLLAHPDRVERIGLGALHAVNRILRRAPETGEPDLRRSTNVLASIHPRGRDWALGLGAALMNWIADFVCLYASCQAVGVNDRSIGVILLAYLSGMSVSGVSLVPAGLGVVDAAVILVLVQNGVGAGPAAAAMLLYRVFAFGFGVVAGWCAWFANARSRRTADRIAVSSGTADGSPSGHGDLEADTRPPIRRHQRAAHHQDWRAIGRPGECTGRRSERGRRTDRSHRPLRGDGRANTSATLASIGPWAARHRDHRWGRPSSR